MINGQVFGLFYLMRIPVMILATCGPNEWTCNDGMCILSTHLCDHNSDCIGSEDEIQANCGLTTVCPNVCTEGQYICNDCSCVTSENQCVNQVSTEATTQVSTEESANNKPSPESEKDKTGIIVIAVLGFLLLAIIIGVVLYQKQKKKHRVDQTMNTEDSSAEKLDQMNQSTRNKPVPPDQGWITEDPVIMANRTRTRHLAPISTTYSNS